MPSFFETPRARRLKRDHEEMLRLRSQSSILDFTTEGSPPERYLLTFRGRGLSPKGGFVDRHQVHVSLGVDYPTGMPAVSWATPIHHPNISTTNVCFGNFSMTPYVKLVEIVEILWDMARMAVFNPHGAYLGASVWYNLMKEVDGYPVDPRILRDLAPQVPRQEEQGPPDIVIIGAGGPAALAPEAVKSRIEEYLRAREWDQNATVYTQKEWMERGEKYGNNAPFTIAAEGGLYHLLNYADWPGALQELEEWNGFLASLGLWYELGYAWSVHLYPLADPPPIPPGVKEWRPR